MLLSTKDKIKTVGWVLFQFLLLTLMFFIGYTSHSPRVEINGVSWREGIVMSIVVLGGSWIYSLIRKKRELEARVKKLESQETSHLSRAHPQHSILLLGDENVVHFLKEYLQQFDILRIYTATNPEEGKTKSLKTQIQLVIAETHILGQADLEIAAALREIKCLNPQAKIIVSSDSPKGYGPQSPLGWLDVDYCFNKPIQLESLAPKVFELLGEIYTPITEKNCDRCEKSPD